MNLLNSFKRTPDSEVPVSETMGEESVSATVQTEIPLQNSENSSSERLNVPQQPAHAENLNPEPWIVRDPATFEEEKRLMHDAFPNFQLEVIDFPESPYHGCTCWSGKLKPGIFEDTEWKILLIYLPLGFGEGDWSGAISAYFENPTATQIVETLGYTPKCMLMDDNGTQILTNIRPVLLNGRSASVLLKHVETFCKTIERMCAGELPENTLMNIDFTQNS